MDPLVLPAIAITSLLAIASIAGHWKKRRAVVAAFLMILGGAIGLRMGALDFGAGFDGGPWDSIWLLLVWLEFTLLIQWAGGVPLRGPLGPLALLGGALIGEVGAALLLCPRAGSSSNRARVALTASAGAMMSPVGSPVTLLLVEPGHFGFGLPLVLAAVTWPRGWAEDDPHAPLLPLTSTGANRNLWVMAAVLLAVILGPSEIWALFAGCLLLMVLNVREKGRPHTSWGLQVWILAVAVLVFFAQSTGVFWEMKEGLRLWMESGSSGVNEGAVLAGALMSALGTEEGAAMISASVAEAGLSGVPGAVWTPFAAGLAVGGLTPLICSRALFKGLSLWFVQLGVVLLWFSVLC